jgi:hypothetical protein
MMRRRLLQIASRRKASNLERFSLEANQILIVLLVKTSILLPHKILGKLKVKKRKRRRLIKRLILMMIGNLLIKIPINSKFKSRMMTIFKKR